MARVGGDRRNYVPDGREHLSGNADLLLQKLLHEEHDEAIGLFERLCRSGGDFDLAGYLNEKDYRDCLFLLGEAYEKKGLPGRALEFYEKVHELERKQTLRYFFDELCERIRAIRGG